jgi:N-formylglutamate amidohydrolase
VPHAGTHIPDALRPAILLDDTALARELLLMTDLHTDVLFGWTVERGAVALVNQWSRLVLDPERFADPAAEPMDRVGQGVVYTRASDGRPLRVADPGLRARLIDALYEPWHRELSALVGEQLERHGTCLVLDCHSFGSVPLPSEADQAPDRPDVCVGTDGFHTPTELADALEASLRAEAFTVKRDSPFSGAMVPHDRYRSDRRVRSVMLEVRRGLYCDEATGELLAGWGDVARRIERACLAAGVIPSGTDPLPAPRAR